MKIYNRGFTPIIIVIAIIVVLIGGGAVYYLGKNLDTSHKKIDTDTKTTNSDNSKSKNINKTTNISCGSEEMPLIQKGEQITKQIREDLDNDGVKELMVVYQHMVPGFEGMQIPSYRFTLFTCEKGLLTASYEVNPYLGSLDFINYESGKAILLNRYGGGWDVLIKNGTTFEKLSPTNQRLQELQKLGVISGSLGFNENVLNNKIEEIIGVGPSSGDIASLCIGGGEYVKIIYEFKNYKFNVISVDAWKGITLVGKSFKYPISWSCSYYDKSTPETLKVQAYNYLYNLYPISHENEVDSISFSSIRKNVMDCNTWLQKNNYKHKACVLLGDSRGYDGDRNSVVVYTNSDLQAVIDSFNMFLETNKLNN